MIQAAKSTAQRHISMIEHTFDDPDLFVWIIAPLQLSLFFPIN